jgi:hypothetical protein
VAGSCKHSNQPFASIKYGGIYLLSEKVLTSQGPCFMHYTEGRLINDRIHV